MKDTRRRLRVEPLEDRTLLSINVSVVDDTIFVTEDQYDLIAVEWSGNVYSVDETTGQSSLLGASGFSGLNGHAQAARCIPRRAIRC